MAREADPGEVGIEERKYVRLPTFMERGFVDLQNEVTAKRICCVCGTCAAFCDKITINEGEGGRKEPRFIENYDTVCGLCYAFCPRTFLPLPEIERRIFGEERKRAEGDTLGVYRSYYTVRSKKADIIEKGQDGGAVTSLLAYALDEGIIDCAVVTTSDNKPLQGLRGRGAGPHKWKPITKVARTYEELKEGAGTKYTIYPCVVGVKEAMEEGCNAIGFVGLPCQVQGLRKVQTAEQPYDVGIEKVRLVIGLFCMENFTEALLDFVASVKDLDEVNKFDIKGEEFLIYGYGGDRQAIRLDEVKEYISEGCLVCMDFTAELADISVGSVSSEEGWSTVFARTERGEEVVKGALEKGYIEAKEMEIEGLKSIRRLAKNKRIRAA